MQSDFYWTASQNTHNGAVAKAMSRNRFTEIFSNLHMADIASLNDDRDYKVRPLFEILNHNVIQLSSTTHHSIDESMTPYYGKHRTKQFIHGKPIRFVFKLWSITSTDRYLLHVELYCGSDTVLKETGLGQGGDVVMGLIKYVCGQKGVQ